MARGGFRPGAGRKKGSGLSKEKKQKPVIPKDIKVEAKKEQKDPLTYMLDVMNDAGAEDERRDRMAIAAAPFVHSRKGEGKGKKDEQADKARQAASGKYAPSRPPVALVK